MTESSIRRNRIEELIFEELETIIPLEMQDPRVVNCKVTRVQLSADMKSCKVFIVSLDTRENHKTLTSTLNHASSFIRSQISWSLSLKYTPNFKFIYDDEYERALKVNDCIKKLNITKGEEVNDE